MDGGWDNWWRRWLTNGSIVLPTHTPPSSPSSSHSQTHSHSCSHGVMVKSCSDYWHVFSCRQLVQLNWTRFFKPRQYSLFPTSLLLLVFSVFFFCYCLIESMNLLLHCVYTMWHLSLVLFYYLRNRGRERKSERSNLLPTSFKKEKKKKGFISIHNNCWFYFPIILRLVIGIYVKSDKQIYFLCTKNERHHQHIRFLGDVCLPNPLKNLPVLYLMVLCAERLRLTLGQDFCH